jgi:hypothetical protein
MHLEDKYRKAHTHDELANIFKTKGIEEKYYSKFFQYYDTCFEELNEDYKNYTVEDFKEEGSVQDSALYVTNLYIEPFLDEVSKGHGEDWAHFFAYCLEEGEHKVYTVYEELYALDPQLAKQEIVIHCNTLQGDEHFVKHYLFLFEIGDGILEPEKKSRKYSQIYKEQLAKGKSPIFSHEFADLMADGTYHRIYCEEFAYAYDKAMSQGKSLEYGRHYADLYGSALVDIKRRAGICDDEEMIDYAIEKVEAEMKIWEQAEKNNRN